VIWLKIQPVCWWERPIRYGHVLILPDRLICFAGLPSVKSPTGHDLSWLLIASGFFRLSTFLGSRRVWFNRSPPSLKWQVVYLRVMGSRQTFDVLDRESPLQRLVHPVLAEAGVEAWIKRDDQLSLPAGDMPAFCGNKWRKLNYNLRAAREQGHQRLLTFGGAYSNHIAAVAAAGQLFGFSTVGVVRGEPHHPLNPTLACATSLGMHLHHISRSAFRQKHTPEVQEELEQRFAPYYSLPEGGTNELALRGCEELAREITAQLGKTPDYVCVAAGTGGTAAGLIRGAEASTSVLVFPALKGDFMHGEIEQWLTGPTAPWEVVSDYHFGGYAKWKPELLAFMRAFREETGITLDPIYTGKLLYGILAEAQKKRFPTGCTVVVIHTGGLQGIAGFTQRFGRIYRD